MKSWAFYDGSGALLGGVLGSWKFYDATGVVIVPAGDHGALSGLADDDHPQYQLRSEEDAASGYAGLNSASRITKGSITTDDHIVNNAAKGLVLKDTQGTPHFWRVTIDNTGALVTTDLGTSAP